MTDRIECVGGPLDGKSIPDRGLAFEHPAVNEYRPPAAHVYHRVASDDRYHYAGLLDRRAA